jgi:hypothetical protein
VNDITSILQRLEHVNFAVELCPLVSKHRILPFVLQIICNQDMQSLHGHGHHGHGRLERPDDTHCTLRYADLASKGCLAAHDWVQW